MIDNTKLLEEKLDFKHNILYKYTGSFNQTVIKEYASKLNEISVNNKRAQRQLFYVFVELGQNVGYYSERREDGDDKTIGIGDLIIYENEEDYGFIIGNYINKDARKKM